MFRLLAVAVAVVAGCAVKVEPVAGYRCDDGVTCPPGQRCLGGFCYADPPDARAAVDTTDDARVGVDPPWWDDAWELRVPLTIASESPEPIPVGYEVRFLTDLTAYGDYPFDELRIVRWDGATWTEKDRLLDDFPDELVEEQFWFALDEELPPGGATTAYFMYYRNPSATAAPATQTNVFPIFYESFSTGPTSTTRWELSAATIANVDSELVLDPGESVRSLTTWGPGYALDVKHRRGAAAADSWHGFQRSADFVDDQPWAIWIDWTGTGSLTPDSHIAAVGDTTNTTGPAVAPGTTEHVYTIERHADHLVFGYDGGRHDQRDLQAEYLEPLQIRLRNGSGAAILYFDAARVRRIVEPEPTVRAGPVEVRP